MEVIFKISEGGELENTKQLRRFFKDLLPGSYLLIAKPAKQRSLQQNKYWWGYLVPTVKDALRDMGFEDIRTNNDCHELLKSMFFKKEIVNHTTGEVLTTVGSTTEATTVIFSERIADIQQWAAQYLNIVVLDPGQKIEIDF